MNWQPLIPERNFTYDSGTKLEDRKDRGDRHAASEGINRPMSLELMKDANANGT
jgi:hypothetical protein